jgi:hypothetical protein
MMKHHCLSVGVLDDPYFFDVDLSIENLVRLEVAQQELLADRRGYAEQILRGEAERDPRVFFGIFFRRRT